ncbi:CDP-alcohol phosphatidyltransferase family protein [Candidatus Woesearchaeota archaeon]|nr:CDP-alcohol phosphatidyltransferase family protein [Candidatus Woesearchaeota archaeon]
MHKNFNIPNSITFFRLLFVIPLVYFLVKEMRLYAIGLYVLFLLLDLVDGYLARKLNQSTSFGEIFDYIADVAFCAAVFLVQAIMGRIWSWILWLSVLHYVIMLVLILMKMRKQGRFENHKFKKFSALVHFGFIFLLIINIYNPITTPLFIILLLCMFWYDLYYYTHDAKGKK